MTSRAIFRFNMQKILQSPQVFFKHPFFIKLNTLILSPNQVILYFIGLILKIKKQEIENIDYSSGTLKVFTRKQIYKIGTRFGPLKQEANHIKLIREKFPLIAQHLLPTENSQGLLLQWRKMDRYVVPQGEKSLECADQILQKFSHYAIKQKCSIAEFPHILHGLKLAKILYPSLDVEAKVKVAFSVPWNIGPVHGDFHQGNILVDDKGFPFVIDLDNFNMKGIQALDHFTFWVGIQVQKRNMVWQEVIRNALKTDTYQGKHSIELIAFLYLLNRLGLENIDYGFLSQSVAKEFRLLEEL